MTLLLAAAAIKSGRRARGPFGVPELGGDGTFTPSGEAFTTAQAVFAALGASGYIYIFDTDSLRATEGGADGIASGSIGYANDWRAPGVAASAAVAEGDRRPTLTTISGATCATLDGVDDELAWPFLGWSSGTLLLVSTMTDAADANQTALEIDALRIQSQFAGFTGPTVRVGGGVHVPFGLNSMLNRLTLKVVQFNRTANTLRIWHDGAAGWTESNVAAWDANPHESWERGNFSLLGRNSYEPTAGAPMTGGIHALVAIDTNALTIQQVEDLAGMATSGTAISVSVPAYPGAGGGGGGEEELPTALNTFNVANQTALNNAISAADPGDHIVIANGTYNLPSIARSGTSANPIVIRAANNQGVTLSGLGDVTGNYVRLWGCNCGAQSFGNLTGTDFWVIRCKFIGGGGRRMQFKAPRAHFWYCEMTGQGQGIIFDTGDSVGGPGVMGIEGHVKGCYFHDYAMGAAFGNGNEPISVGRSINRTFVVSNTLIEDCLFEDCNIGGQEDETIAVKSSFVTVRNCTFVNARYLSNRHGKGNFYDRIMHINSGAGGISINDGGGNQCRNCETRGGSRIRVMAGGVNSQDEGPPNWQTNDLGTQPVWPRSNGAVIDHANCVDTRAIIGFEFGSPYPGGLKPAINTVWRANRGLAPTLGTTAQQTGTTQPGASPVAYVPPVVLTTNDVGVLAG